MNKYNVVMEMNDSTVVTEYEPIKRKSDSYQSEQALENEFIRLLTEQGYDYLEIHDSVSAWSFNMTERHMLAGRRSRTAWPYRNASSASFLS